MEYSNCCLWKTSSATSRSHHADFDLGDEFTIEFWMRSIDSSFYPGGQTLIGRGGFNDGYRVLLYNGRINFQVDAQYPGDNDISSTTVLDEGTWYHIACTFDKTNDAMNIYINGALDVCYEYDLDGFLTLPDASVIVYIHDPLGRRIAKTVDGVLEENYLWQGLTRLLAVYDGSDYLTTVV